MQAFLFGCAFLGIFYSLFSKGLLSVLTLTNFVKFFLIPLKIERRKQEKMPLFLKY